MKEQQETVRNPNKEGLVDSMARQGPRRKIPAIPAAANLHTATVCRHYGKGSHPKNLCPAKEAQCFCCYRRGHFSIQCLLTTVASATRHLQELTTETSMTDNSTTKIAYLDTLNSSKKVWEVEVNVTGKTVTFKVDTGAEVTALSDSTWKSLGIKTPLKSAGLSLFGPDETPLNLLGKTTFATDLQWKYLYRRNFVVKGLKSNLLGLPTIKELSLITNVCAIENGITSQYPSLFHGLGTFLQEYEIKLSQTVNHFY